MTTNRILTSPNSGMSQAIPDGVVYTEYVVPLKVNVRLADGTYGIALPTIVNLTALGLV